MNFRGGLLAAGLLIGLAAGQAGCTGEPLFESDRASLHLVVDSSSAPLAESLLNVYESTQPYSVFTLEQSNRPAVLDAVTSGSADAALLVYPPDQSPLFYTPVAYDLLVIVTGPDTGVSGVSGSDLRAIYTGRITNWSELGGDDQVIQVVSREGQSSLRLAADRMILDALSLTPMARLAVSDEAALDLIASGPGAIGYVPYSAFAGDLVALEIDGVPPTLEAARRQQYPLVVPLVFVSAQEPQGAARAFLDWVLGTEGQAVVKRHMLGLDEH